MGEGGRVGFVKVGDISSFKEEGEEDTDVFDLSLAVNTRYPPIIKNRDIKDIIITDLSIFYLFIL